MPVGQGGMGCFLRFEKVEVRYQVPKKFGFRGALVVSLLCEVRLHLSIAFESKLSSLCIRFALTLLCEVRLHLSIAFENEFSSLCTDIALNLELRLSLMDEKTKHSLIIQRSLTSCYNRK